MMNGACQADINMNGMRPEVVESKNALAQLTNDVNSTKQNRTRLALATSAASKQQRIWKNSLTSGFSTKVIQIAGTINTPLWM